MEDRSKRHSKKRKRRQAKAKVGPNYGHPTSGKPPESKEKPSRPPIEPFYSEARLAHACQTGWDCVLHAFRACVRSRSPTLDTFISDCTKLGFVVADDQRRSGLSIGMLRIWLFHHWPQYALKKIHGNFTVEYHFIMIRT